MARPKKDIDPDKVRQLAERMWKNTEIAGFFGVDEGTIRKRFSDILAKSRETAKGKLRDLQWQAAENGNSTMLIWLGKQYLEQRDHTNIEVENAGQYFAKIADAISGADTNTDPILSRSAQIRN